MAQYLKTPIDEFKPTAGYKNQKYKEKYKYTHYGMDGYSTAGNNKLYALGEGTVIAAGLDGINGKTTGDGSGCGYVVVIVYEDCVNNKTGKTSGIVSTYMHLKEMPKVKAGQKVNKNTLLGYYGATGKLVDGVHLHTQFDTDIKNPLYCQGLSDEGHSILKRGIKDTTVNPCDWLWLDKGQKITTASSIWYAAADFKNIPEIPESLKELEFKIGDTVYFFGDTHYVGSDSVKGKKCKPGKAKVTTVAANAKHPYHLKNIAKGGSDVYGWVDGEFVEKVKNIEPYAAKNDKKKVDVKL